MRWCRLILSTVLRIVLINTGLTKRFLNDFHADLQPELEIYRFVSECVNVKRRARGVARSKNVGWTCMES